MRLDAVSVETSKAFSITRLFAQRVWMWIGWTFVESQSCMTVTSSTEHGT